MMNKTARQYTTPTYKRWEVIQRYGGYRYGAEVQRSTAGRSLRLRVRAYYRNGAAEDWPIDFGPELIGLYRPDKISQKHIRLIRMALCFMSGYLHCIYGNDGRELNPLDMA